MKVTLENTSKVVILRINGVEVPARIWQGETAEGVQCHAYITRIAVAEGLNAAEFERDLEEQAKPRVDVAALPTRLIL